MTLKSWHWFSSHKANLMTFCIKCHDINLMTLGRWHSIKNWLLVKNKENNYHTCVVYLLNGIDIHFLLIEMFLVCLKINMRHSKNIDVETCRPLLLTSQCTKWLFPTTAMCVKTVSSNETFGCIGCQGEMLSQCHQRYWDAISALLTFCWHSCCANVMSWYYWTILVGRGPGEGIRNPWGPICLMKNFAVMMRQALKCI